MLQAKCCVLVAFPTLLCWCPDQLTSIIRAPTQQVERPPHNTTLLELLTMVMSWLDLSQLGLPVERSCPMDEVDDPQLGGNHCHLCCLFVTR